MILSRRTLLTGTGAVAALALIQASAGDWTTG